MYSCYSIADGDVDIDLTVIGILTCNPVAKFDSVQKVQKRLVELHTAVVEKQTCDCLWQFAGCVSLEMTGSIAGRHKSHQHQVATVTAEDHDRRSQTQLTSPNDHEESLLSICCH